MSRRTGSAASRTGIDEVPRGQLSHFTRADQHDGAALQRVEDLLAKLDCHITDRDGAARDARFVSDSFGDAERVMNQPVQHTTNSSGFNSNRVRVTHLAENLRLAP